jgi:serine/threonine protein kinase
LAKLSTLRDSSGNTNTLPTVAVDPDHLTSPGAALGTVAYMSPEQVRAKPLDARTDLFSFGVVLYEMATGTLPFRGESSGVIFESILNRSPIPAANFIRGIPAELDRIIQKALEKDRDLRYQHASDTRTDLKRLKRDTDSGRSAAPRDVPSTPALSPTAVGALSASVSSAAVISTPASRRWPITVGAPFMLLLAFAGYYWFFRPRPHAPPQVKERQLTTNSSENAVSAGQISPDGSKIAFASKLARVGLGDIWLMQADGEQPRKLVEAEQDSGFESVAWSPGGQRLAYARYKQTPEKSSLTLRRATIVRKRMWHSVATSGPYL